LFAFGVGTITFTGFTTGAGIFKTGVAIGRTLMGRVVIGTVIVVIGAIIGVGIGLAGIITGATIGIGTGAFFFMFVSTKIFVIINHAWSYNFTLGFTT